MVELETIIRFLNETLDVQSVKDYGPQGLQVEGKPEVSGVVTGVSCSLSLFDEAVQRGAELIVVHHGLIWDRDPRVISGVYRRRLARLLTNDVSLAAYHLPLDAHQELGHSARIVTALGLVDGEPFGSYGSIHLGRRGRFLEPQPVANVVERIRDVTGHEPQVFAGGPSQVSTVAVCSGGGADMVAEAASLGIDLFVTGEPREGTKQWCMEAGITFVAAGHYDTEKPGIIALGELLAGHFSLPVEFIDLPNPV